jgi:hypothetical protein
MTDCFVPRTLSFWHDGEQVDIAAEDALTDARLAGRPLIVLAGAVIGTDPLAVVDYGNADDLKPAAAKALLQAIKIAEDRNEAFGLREYRAAALVQPDLADEVERVPAVSGNKRFRAQVILLRQLRDRDTVVRHAATLRAIMLDEAQP